jgi:hypothetical protein
LAKPVNRKTGTLDGRPWTENRSRPAANQLIAQDKEICMNANKASTDLTPPAVKAARHKFLPVAILLSLLCVLLCGLSGFFLSQYLSQHFIVLTAPDLLLYAYTLLGIGTISNAIVISIRQKRITIFPAVLLLCSLFFISSSSILSYGKTLPDRQEVILNLIASGLFCIGIGSVQILNAYMQRKNKISKYLVILMVVGIGFGIFSVVHGIERWNTLLAIIPTH